LSNNLLGRRKSDIPDQPPNTEGYISFHLEKKGPFGDPSPQTSNRAELRAVIAALRFRVWEGEGFKSIVIATDSEYVAEGATTWVRTWVKNGWNGRAGPVKNKDMWQALLGEFERCHDNGLEVLFWRIPREQNTHADQWAKAGAGEEDVKDKFIDIMGVLV
jgi:ribonuclease HI